MQVGRVNVVYVFFCAVARHAQIADHLAGSDNFSLIHVVVGVVFAQMAVVIIPLFIKASDPDPPASVLVPAKGFYWREVDLHFNGETMTYTQTCKDFIEVDEPTPFDDQQTQQPRKRF